ncbi:hypothetical protein SEA_PUPPER_46 [Gordonia phage Pupper]|uniref:Uncharacterized protein n=1 Tax=Gordonia phage Pupper TaxID=2571249 RepID=A0A4Y6EJ80_9CAUD|nr:hypothetical protein KHQ83_gp231 [Gordonia phage Pupper]QDF18532.1 hypothetical protein SEA_PUPPER_46 [Gordonia phage Pupper]
MRLRKTPVRYPYWYPRVFINHGPGAVRKVDVGWRTINGLAWRIGNNVYWWSWREKKGLGY